MTESIEPIERLLRTSQVAALEGMSTRWLFEQIRKDRYPKPDFPHKRKGEPDRWLESTIRRAREQRQAHAPTAAR